MNNHEEYGGGGKNSNRNGDDYGHSDESDDEDNSHQEDQHLDHNRYNGDRQGTQNSRGDHRGGSDGNHNNNQDHRNNNYNDDYRKQQRYLHAVRADRFGIAPARHGVGQMQPLGDYSGNSWPHQNGMRGGEDSGNKSRDIDNQNSTSKNGQRDNGESCMVLCFFKELKMVNL